MSTHRIAVIAGDGIGTGVGAEGAALTCDMGGTADAVTFGKAIEAALD